jgi:UDP-N-acetylmuramate: L-alanyl-gamma-D-glutamyl-meso-diaminopimelate ligase
MQKAIELGIRIYSFPEFMYENNKEKKRIVVAGSHGKTTITAMIMHALSKLGYDFDYMVGSGIKGFEDSVRLSMDAPWIVLEGDEYLTSALDKRPKFLWYKPHFTLISGVSWDHMNVFPTYEIYKKQFSDYLDSLPGDSVVVFCGQDTELSTIVNSDKKHRQIPYSYPAYRTNQNKFELMIEGHYTPLSINGSHNLLNLEGAACLCEQMGIAKTDFYRVMTDFSGAGKRLETIYKKPGFTVFRDFAHAPSKVKATIEGIKAQYPDRNVIACLELHTYSSLNKDFLPQYKGTVDKADFICIYVNPEEVKLKRLQDLDAKQVKEAFCREDMDVCFSIDALRDVLAKPAYTNAILLLMSSGNFNGWDMKSFAEGLYS